MKKLTETVYFQVCERCPTFGTQAGEVYHRLVYIQPAAKALLLTKSLVAKEQMPSSLKQSGKDDRLNLSL